MESNNIKPERITKPIQLLAVWLLGLILLVSAFITAAATIKDPKWLAPFFSISSVAIIPLFLILIFLLQTRFRPQMQEDEYYAKYLNSNTKSKESIAPEILFDTLSKKIDEKLIELSSITKEQISLLNESVDDLISKKPFEIEEPKNQNRQRLIGKFDEFIKENKNIILLNTLLVRSEEIEKLLSNNDIKIDETFGDGNELPEKFLLSFGSSVDVETIKFLINGLIEFGLTHLRIVIESFKQNHIYIGSYAYKGPDDKPQKTAVITKTLLEEVNKLQSSQEIFTLVQTKMN